MTMTKKSFESIDKKGRKTVWEWEETPELVAWIKSQSNLKIVPPNRPKDKS